MPTFAPTKVVKDLKRHSRKQGHRLIQSTDITFVDGERPHDKVSLLCTSCKKNVTVEIDRGAAGKVRIGGDFNPLDRSNRCRAPMNQLSTYKAVKPIRWRNRPKPKPPEVVQIVSPKQSG